MFLFNDGKREYYLSVECRDHPTHKAITFKMMFTEMFIDICTQKCILCDQYSHILCLNSFRKEKRKKYEKNLKYIKPMLAIKQKIMNE